MSAHTGASWRQRRHIALQARARRQGEVDSGTPAARSAHTGAQLVLATAIGPGLLNPADVQDLPAPKGMMGVRAAAAADTMRDTSSVFSGNTTA